MKFNLAVAIVLSLALTTFDLVRAVDLIRPLGKSGSCLKSKFTPGDGTQLKQPSCVSLNIGEIPAVGNMVTALLVQPPNNSKIPANKPFNVTAAVQGLTTGFFSDAAQDYYQIPQTLDGKGLIQGHSHITIQQLTSNTAPPNPQVFAFFKGLNEPAVNGLLTVAVDKGLPNKGLYRICTMNSSNSHQPVVMPVAQRGSQDDCIRVTVI